MKKSIKTKPFSVVAIGASAGGLEAFSDLLSALPPKPGMAFVLVPHLAPQYESHLSEILARSTKLPVSEVKGGDKVRPNQIYIIPPNRAMLIKGGVLHLSAVEHNSVWRNPIDSFFRSLAQDQKKENRRRRMQQNVCGMMPARSQPMPLAIHHVGQTGNRMPVGGMDVGERPENPGERQTTGNIRIVVDVGVVVVIDEVVMNRLPEDDRRDRRQKDANAQNLPAVA